MNQDNKHEAFAAALQWATKYATEPQREAMLAVLQATAAPVMRPPENEVERLRREHVDKWARRDAAPKKVGKKYNPTKANQKWWHELTSSAEPLTAQSLAQRIGKPNKVLDISNVLSALYRRGLVTREGTSGSFAYRVAR